MPAYRIIRKNNNVHNFCFFLSLPSFFLGDSPYLWLVGGYGAASSTSGTLSDVWRYNVNTQRWMWASGSNVANVNPVYGTMKVAHHPLLPALTRSHPLSP